MTMTGKSTDFFAASQKLVDDYVFFCLNFVHFCFKLLGLYPEEFNDPREVNATTARYPWEI